MQLPTALPIDAEPATAGKSPLRLILSPLYRSLFRLEVHGEDRIPREGPCLLVFNHLSNVDAHLFLVLVPRDDATGLVASEYRDKPLERLLVEAGGGMWLRRGEGDRATLRRALDLLSGGWLVGLAPEGGRSPDGRLRKGKRGAAMLALRSGAPVLPVAVQGTNQAFAAWKRLRRPTVRVTFGVARRYHRLPGTDFRSESQRVTDDIMKAIASLLPEELRGAYAHSSLPECGR